MKPPRFSFFQLIKMVLSGFIGIRKSSHSHVAQHVKPKAIILTGLGCGLILVLVLTLLVNCITHYAS